MVAPPVTVPEQKMDEAAKRKLEMQAEESSPEKEQLAKRSHVENVPVPMALENFSPELLRIYYERLFPFKQMFRWLSYGNDPKGPKDSMERDFFHRREFTFVLEGDTYCRYQCFRDDVEWKQKVLEQRPVRMEIGAVYTHLPKNHNTIAKDAYYPLQRELVFDIDMDDYDDIRHCCSGANLCTKCWTFMTCAIKTLNRALREDFGFQHMMFVYSGRRGVHCWIGDATARLLSNEQRAAVAEYLNLVSGGGRCKTEIKMYGSDKMHPSIRKAYHICQEYFKKTVEDQNLFKQGPHLEQILEALTKEESENIRKYIEKNPEASSTKIWNKIEEIEAGRKRTLGGKNDAESRIKKNIIKEIVLQHSYPRLDINVSKQMNHLLKAPFVIHPKTGRVCVPIDPATAEQFDPAKVPTLGQLFADLNASGDAKETSLKPYTHFFEHSFIQPLEASNARERRENADPFDF